MTTHYNQNLKRLCAPASDYREDEEFSRLYYNSRIFEEGGPSGALPTREISPLRSENDPHFIALKSSPFSRVLIYDHIDANTSATHINIHRKLGNLSVD